MSLPFALTTSALNGEPHFIGNQQGIKKTDIGHSLLAKRSPGIKTEIYVVKNAKPLFNKNRSSSPPWNKTKTWSESRRTWLCNTRWVHTLRYPRIFGGLKKLTDPNPHNEAASVNNLGLKQPNKATDGKPQISKEGILQEIAEIKAGLKQAIAALN